MYLTDPFILNLIAFFNLVLLVRHYSLKRTVVQTQRKVKGDAEDDSGAVATTADPGTDASAAPSVAADSTATQHPKDLEKQDVA